MPDVLDYNSYDCLKIIQEKLNEQKISSIIMSKNKIFITWKNLEEKIIVSKETQINLSSDETVNKYNNKYSDQY